MEEQHTPKPESCKNSVMSRIECGDVCPRPKMFFRTRECAVWALWALSVVVGALAVAVTLFVLTHRQYALYEATHDTFWTFMIEVLPFLWVVLFGVMVLVAVYNLRHTKNGYRYPLWQIFGSSVVLSLAGGAALQLFGFGYATDHMLGQHMRMYDSQEKLEERMWQAPEDGRLLGRFGGPLPAPSTLVRFTDVSGNEWGVNIDEFSTPERALLQQDEPVRLIGVISKDDTQTFYGCGAFPWTLDKPMSREDLKAAKEAFKMKIEGYKERSKEFEDRMEGKLRREEEEHERDSETPCGELEPVKRMMMP